MSQQALDGQPPGLSTAELPETCDPEVNPGAIIKKSTESQLLPVNANDTTASSKDKVLLDPSKQPPKCNTNASAKADLPTDTSPSEVAGGTLQASQGQASSSGGLHQETCPPSGPASAKPNHHWKKPKRPRKKLTIPRSTH